MADGGADLFGPNDGNEEEFEFADSGGNEDDDKFDQFVGCLQDIVLDPTYHEMEAKFCKQNCIHFENTEENKLIYMTIFKKW